MSGYIPTDEAWIPLPKKRTDPQAIQWSEDTVYHDVTTCDCEVCTAVRG